MLNIIFHFTDSRLLLFEELYEIDRELTTTLQLLIAKALVHTKFHQVHKKMALRNVAIAGSTYEGAMISQFFKSFNGNTAREHEADIEITLLKIPASCKHFVEDIPDKEGFATICVTDDFLWTFYNESGWNINIEEFEKGGRYLFENGYFDQYTMKKYLEKLCDVPNTTCNLLEILLSAAFRKKVKLIFRPHKQTKATVEGNLDIYISHEYFLHISWDIATIFRINWWPDIAREWIFRKRNWPEKKVIKDLTSICYLITKSSVAPSSRDAMLEMRYSFAHVERELIGRRSPAQAYIYLIFKSMFYKWIKPLDSEVIGSFIVKTIMFWVCEEFPPEHRMWHRGSCIGGALNYLLRQLLSALKRKNLRYYFIPSINVIEMINDTLINQIKSIVEGMVCDTGKFVPCNVTSVIDISREVINLLRPLKHILNTYFTFHSIGSGKTNSLQSQVLVSISLFPEIIFFFTIFLIELNRFCLICRRK